MADREDATNTERELVVFSLANAAYGIDIESVREIIRIQDITRVPNAPESIEGVINLRGKICPIVDMRKRFEVEAGDETENTRIVVVDVDTEQVGIIVDAVNEVLTIREGAVHPASTAVSSNEAEFIEGIAEVESGLILLIALERVLKVENRKDAVETGAAAA